MNATYAQQLKQAIQEATQFLYPDIMIPEFGVDHPRQENFGDYASNIAMQLAPVLKEAPLKIAQAIAEKLAGNELVKKAEAVPPGFINILLPRELLRSEMELINSQGDEYGKSDFGQNKKVIVEFSSPNIAKPFTIGHLRSTIIGSAVANLFEATGWQVFSDNHLGDWGTQFGKQIYAIKTWGNEDEIENSEEPVKKLVELYVKFHTEAEAHPELEDEGRAWFKRLEDGDPEARRLWQKCIDWSWKSFSRLYEKLGVSFTENNGRGYGESYFEDKMQPVLDELKQKSLLLDSKGAQLVFFPDEVLPPLMIIKQDGATLYATRDLATDKFRFERYGKDIKIINEVGAEQELYFRQLYLTEQLLGWTQPNQRVHIKHGLYRFADKKMSTRKGNVIWLEEVLDEAIKHAHKLDAKMDDKTAEMIGIGALKWNDLKKQPHLDVVFDWEEILNMQGNSGPYVQYAYARGCSVLRKAQESDETFPSSLGYSPNGDEIKVMRWLYQFPEVVQEATANYLPSILANYIYELAQRFNTFYNNVSILGADSVEAKAFRLELVQAITQVLKNGLGILGIQAPEKV